jgi:hypothetical protein
LVEISNVREDRSGNPLSGKRLGVEAVSQTLRNLAQPVRLDCDHRIALLGIRHPVLSELGTGAMMLATAAVMMWAT